MGSTGAALRTSTAALGGGGLWSNADLLRGQGAPHSASAAAAACLRSSHACTSLPLLPHTRLPALPTRPHPLQVCHVDIAGDTPDNRNMCILLNEVRWQGGRLCTLQIPRGWLAARLLAVPAAGSK